MRRRIAAALLALAPTACAEEPARTPQPAPPDPAAAPHARAAPPAHPARDARLRDDCGGWDPAADLLDAAAALADAARREALSDSLDAGPLARKIDVLRAGLRLADDDAARACAARLEWRWIDGWESARVVDLLVTDVFRPGTEADFEEFRWVLGSADLARLVESSPPLPWDVEPVYAIGQLHRIGRGRDLAPWLAWSHRPERAIADAAWEQFLFLLNWNDDALGAWQAAVLPGQAVPETGFPPIVRAWWTDALAWEPMDDTAPWDPDAQDRRWMLRLMPSEADADLLCESAARLHPRAASKGFATLLLGKLRDARSEALLRKLTTEEDDPDAWFALARRGDPVAVDRLAREAAGDSHALALLMECAPDRARTLIEDSILGDDEDAALAVLGVLGAFAVPGRSYALGFDWRRTRLDGLEAKLLAEPRSAVRLARAACVVPGLRTTRIAEAAALALGTGTAPVRADGHEDGHEDGSGSLFGDDAEEMAIFLETGAPDAFRVALRRIARTSGPDADRAADFLARMGDPESAELLLGCGTPWEFLARSRCDAVRRALESAVRSGTDEDPNGRAWAEAARALATFHGLPYALLPIAWDDAETPAVAAILDGRPADAMALVLAAAPDEEHGDVGAVDDPRVRSYLGRLRERRDLGLYWYATGQLAAMGDRAARAEYWAAIQTGRYGVVDQADAFAATLGWDFAGTIPFWVEELRTNCCRARVARDVFEEAFGFDTQANDRTEVELAQEWWTASGGRLVRSRIAEHWVPAPR